MPVISVGQVQITTRTIVHWKHSTYSREYVRKDIWVTRFLFYKKVSHASSILNFLKDFSKILNYKILKKFRTKIFKNFLELWALLLLF